MKSPVSDLADRPGLVRRGCAARQGRYVRHFKDTLYDREPLRTLHVRAAPDALMVNFFDSVVHEPARLETRERCLRQFRLWQRASRRPAQAKCNQIFFGCHFGGPANVRVPKHREKARREHATTARPSRGPVDRDCAAKEPALSMTAGPDGGHRRDEARRASLSLEIDDAGEG